MLMEHKEYQPGKSHDIAPIEFVNPVKEIKSALNYEKKNTLGMVVWFMGLALRQSVKSHLKWKNILPNNEPF